MLVLSSWHYCVHGGRKVGKENPTTNAGMQNGSSVGIHTRCTHVFPHLAPIFVLSRCLVAKFLHRSSGGSLLKSALLVGKVVRTVLYVQVWWSGKSPLICWALHENLLIRRGIPTKIPARINQYASFFLAVPTNIGDPGDTSEPSPR